MKEAVDNGVKNIPHKLHTIIDYCNRWLESYRLDVDDLNEQFPELKEMILQRRQHLFNGQTKVRNYEKWTSQKKKEMPATIDTVQHHISKQIKSGGEPPYEKLFNLSKNSKDDAPLTGFVEYLAYKIEERKFNLQYASGAAVEAGGRLADTHPVIPGRAFFSYVTEKSYN